MSNDVSQNSLYNFYDDVLELLYCLLKDLLIHGQNDSSNCCTLNIEKQLYCLT